MWFVKLKNYFNIMNVFPVSDMAVLGSTTNNEVITG